MRSHKWLLRDRQQKRTVHQRHDQEVTCRAVSADTKIFFVRNWRGGGPSRPKIFRVQNQGGGPSRPKILLVQNWGGGGSLKTQNFLSPKPGGVLPAENFLSPKPQIKLKFFLLQICISHQISWTGGGGRSGSHVTDTY